MARYNLGLYWDELEVQACMLRAAMGEFAIEKLVRRQRVHEVGKPRLAASEDIKSVLAELGIPVEVCITALSEHEIMYRQVKRPFTDRRKIAATIGPEVETLLPISEDINVDFVVIGKDDMGETLLEAAAAKSVSVQRLIAECASAGLDPEIIESPSSALVAGARNLFNLAPERAYVILHMGWRDTSMCILHGYDITHLGVLPFGFERIVMEVAKDAGKGVQTVIEEALQRGIQAGVHLERLVTEVIIALQRIVGDIDGYVLIPTGYAGYIRDLPDRFVASEINADLPDLKGVQYDGPTRDILLSFMAASLAFRGVDNADMMNFRKGEQPFAKSMERLKGLAGFWGKLIVAIIVVWIAGFGVDMYFKTQVKKKLDTKIKAQFTAVMSPGTPMVAPLEQMEQHLSRLQKKYGEEGGGSDTPLNIIRDISEKIPGEMDAVIESFTLDENGITISGTTQSYDTVEKIKGVLSTLKHITEVKIVSANVNATDQRVMFKLTCKVGGV